MKRIVSLIILAMALGVASAQTESLAGGAANAEQIVSMPKTDWLTNFDKVKIDGPMKVEFKKVGTIEESRIIYDTKGNITSKFKFEVDRKGTLVVSEKSDPKRESVTEIVIYYNSLRDVKIAHAQASFDGIIECDIFDLAVTGGALASLEIKTLDVAVECTGTSRLALSGSTKYLTMRVSTAKVDCSELATVSATVEASHSAEVRVVIDERLEATTTTGAKLLYKGTPRILRDHAVVFGGDIININ